MKGRIFVVDDETLMLQYLKKQLESNGYEVKGFDSPQDAFEELDSENVDLVISDVKMPGVTGDEVLDHVKRHHPNIGVILITGFGSINHAVNAVRKGAFDYITKPFGGVEIMARVNRFFKHRDETGNVSFEGNSLEAPKSAQPASEATKSKSTAGRYEAKLIGNDPKMQNLLSALPQIAQNEAPVLIQGESGTGKEVFASLIHYNSERAEGPYVKINCANLPRELVESTLFGHVKGAFTGAVSDAKGAFDEAQGGTLLLDEITEIELSVQAKLLRVLQEKEFKRVGSQKELKADVRIIATSNRNIGEAIREGSFRKDLYYRLSVFPISIPPLRERRDDITLLAEYFCDKYVHMNGLSEKKISDDLTDYLKNQEWKGNVRELENLMQRGVIMSGKSSEITVDHVRNILFEQVDASFRDEVAEELPLLPIEEMELKLIQKALQRTNGNQKEAARLLGISDRTIRNKLKKIGDDE